MQVRIHIRTTYTHEIFIILGVLIRSEMLPWDWQWVRRWSCVVDEVKALKRELYTFTRLVRDVLE